MLRNFASLQSYLQKLLNSILKDVVELSIKAYGEKRPFPSKKKNNPGKERKETTYTKKKDELGFLQARRYRANFSQHASLFVTAISWLQNKYQFLQF